MSRKRVRLQIQGIVQGVGFRASAAAEARARGVDGWVRNREDGSVELEGEGPEPALRELVAWCRRGPRGARVSDVDERWSDAAGDATEARGFRVRP